VDQKTLLVIVLAVVGLVAAAIFLIPAPAPEVAKTDTVSTEASGSESTVADGAFTPETGAQGGPVSATSQGEVVQTSSGIVAPASASPSRRVVATYFHNTARCVTCRNIEQRSRGAVEAAFAPELASGQLTWRALNMEEKENEHFAIDYDLPYASLVLAEMDGEREVRFKVLGQTWYLVHKRQPLLETYVENETRAFLEGR
jgi:hypothetical protein